MKGIAAKADETVKCYISRPDPHGRGLPAILYPRFRSYLFVCAAMAGMAAFFLCRRIPFIQKYPDFIVGPVAWEGSVKTVDYLAACLALGVFVVVLFVTNALASRIPQRPKGSIWVHSVEAWAGTIPPEFGVTLVPLGWFVGCIAGKLVIAFLLGGPLGFGTLPHHYLLLCLWALILMVAFRRRMVAIDPGASPASLTSLGLYALIGLFVSCAAALAISVVIHQFILVSAGDSFVFVTSIVAAAAAGFSFCLMVFPHNPSGIESVRSGLTRFIVWAQVVVPFLLLTLLPNGRIGSAELPIVLVIFSAVGWSLVVWYRRVHHPSPQDQKGGIYSQILFTPTIICFLIVTLMPSLPLRTSPFDDYHIGEVYLPWQQLVLFHKLPFADLNYPHGFTHLIQGLLASFFPGKPFISFTYGTTLLFAVSIALTFVFLRAVVGTIPSLLFLMTSPFTRSLPFAFIIPFLCLIANRTLCRNPWRWLLAWGIGAVFLPLYSPPTGSAMFVASLPLAGWMAVRAYHYHGPEAGRRGLLTFFLAAGAFVGALALLFTPVGSVFKGFVNFLLENAQANSVANGIPWRWGKHGLIQILWIPASMTIIALMWKTSVAQKNRDRLTVLIFGSALFFFSCALVPYSFGRIDDTGISRAGSMSLWLLYFGIPIMILLIHRPRIAATFLLIFPLYGGFLQASIASQEVKSWSMLVDRLSGRGIEEVVETAGDRNRQIPSGHKGAPADTTLTASGDLRVIIDTLLTPDETYFDLTNHSAQYFHLQRPVPSLESAVYNAPSSMTQARMLGQLQKTVPPVAIAEGNTIIFDGGSVSLRSNRIYRYFTLRYVPVRIGGYTFLVAPGLLETARHLSLAYEGDRSSARDTGDDRPSSRRGEDRDAELLDKAFYPGHLKKIPVSWGRSWASLSPGLAPVAMAGEGTLPANMPEGPQVSQTAVKLSGLGISGADAGMIVFDFACERLFGAAEPEIVLSWVSDIADGVSDSSTIRFYGATGRLVVPVDACPRWLKSRKITAVTLSLINPEICRSSRLYNIGLYQRK